MPPGAAEVLTDRHSLNYLGALPQMMAAVDEPSIQAANANAERPALLIGRVSSSRQAKHCPSLAP
jgi:hypothetical protein